MFRGSIRIATATATGAVAIVMLTLVGFMGVNAVVYALMSPEPAIEAAAPVPELNLITKAD